MTVYGTHQALGVYDLSERRPARTFGRWPWDTYVVGSTSGERLGWVNRGHGVWEHPATGQMRKVEGTHLTFAIITDGTEEALDRLAETGG